MKRIAFVSPPFAGHLNPQLELAAAARRAGYTVSVISAKDLRSVPPGALERIANTDSRVGSNPRLLLSQFRENLALLPAIKAELQDLWREQPPDLVVADSVAPVGGLVCDELGIPWITTIATPFAIENRTGVPAYCGGWRPGHPWRDALGRACIRGFKRAVAWHFRKEFALLGGPFPYREDGTERIYSPRAILGFGITELEFPRDWPASFEMIGPVISCPNPGPPIDFPPAARRVLVSVGTHLLWAKKTLVADVVELAKSFPGVEFAISLGGLNEPGQGPAPNVTVYPFVPYDRDLAKFDAVIHHGGAGVTYAAILNKVPAVVVPHDYDQFDYAARIEHYQLGHRAPSIAGAAPALRQVLETANWPELARISTAARAYRPDERFLEAVQNTIGPA